LRQLEDENRRLKALVADLTLDKGMLSRPSEQKSEAIRRRELERWFQDQYTASVVRACALAQLSRAPGIARAAAPIRRRCASAPATRPRAATVRVERTPR
jgi:hypothetical protein